MEDLFHLTMSPREINQISVLGLAHCGDAVFELLVRSFLCTAGKEAIGNLHRATVERVCAPAQARRVDRMLPLLSEQELTYYKRGRNAHVHQIPKNATREQYAKATGLECLFGALYLAGRVERLNELFFATMEQASAASDVGSVDIDTIALTAGAAANDISAGSITTLVDPIPYISAVTNSAAPSGGSDIEDDESLRRRIMLAPHSFSSAGAAKSYEYWARTADPAVADAKAASPSAGVVNVTVLMDGGKIPTTAQLKAVENVLSDQTVRPLGIQVNVVAAEAVSYTATAKYYISSDDTAEINAIKSRVEAAYADYLVWQKAVLGRAINPDELRRRLLTAGANRVDLSSPQWTALDDDQVAAESTSSALTYGGTL